MSNYEFVPVRASQRGNFFGEDGRPLGASTRCPECNRTFMFEYKGPDGEWAQFVGDCGHAFKVPHP